MVGLQVAVVEVVEEVDLVVEVLFDVDLLALVVVVVDFGIEVVVAASAEAESKPAEMIATLSFIFVWLSWIFFVFLDDLHFIAISSDQRKKSPVAGRNFAAFTRQRAPGSR